ncbi:MAG: ribonuclease P protein component [Candidatus Paceibacterota bacterium]|jgi:ribonuclease P protein component
MLPVKYRIKKELLPLVLKQNKVFPSKYFNLRVHHRLSTEANYDKNPRLAVVIGNKVSPLSVGRHLIKRRIHAILEKVWLEVEGNLDLIIQVKENLEKTTFIDLEKDLLGLLKTAKVLK